MAVTLMCLILLAMCLESTAGSFSLVVPESPISAPLGGSVVLSSMASPSLDPSELRWYRPGQRSNPILLYQNQKIQEEAGDPRYRGRAFFTAGLQKGDVSLTLKNLTLADRGQYVCYVHDGVWYEEAHVSLIVRVTGSTPVMSSSASETGEHVNVSCRSDGWTPEPTVTWRDKNGNQIKQKSNQVYFHDEDGFVGVSSWLLYSSSESDWLSCSVGLSDQERREGRILPAKIIIQSGRFIGPFIITLLALFMLIIWIYVLFRKGVIQFAAASKTDILLQKESNMPQRKETAEKATNTGEEEQVPMNTEGVNTTPETLETKNGLEWQHVKTNRVGKITLNPYTVSVSLKLSKNGKMVKFLQAPEGSKPEDKFPLVLSCESFEYGQHCWGVKLWDEHTDLRIKSKKSWFVGVCRDLSVQTQRFPLTSQNGFWGLQYESETGLFANTDPPTSVEMSNQFQKLGVFLDCDKHTLSFYNVDSQTHLHTFESVISKKLFAVISPGVRDTQVMKICADVEKNPMITVPIKLRF